MLRSLHPDERLNIWEIGLVFNSQFTINMTITILMKEISKMRTSKKLMSALLTLFTLVVVSGAALAAEPGLPYPLTSEASDQKAGSVLFYNYYTSNAVQPDNHDSRICITNTSSTSGAFVHLFFVEDRTCSVADSYICLTANQTACFLASEVDPGVSGYVVAIAVDAIGCPISFNFLIGDEYFKQPPGHHANLGAIAFAALYDGVLPGCDANSVTALLLFDGVFYNRVARALAVSSIASRADGNDTLLIINRFGGNLLTGASVIGPVFGIFYDDAENPLSFTFPAFVCQFRSIISNGFPRLTPRFERFIPAGRSGWFKFWAANNFGLLGAIVNNNDGQGEDSQTGAFSGGHNLHHLTLTNEAYLIPIFPPNC